MISSQPTPSEDLIKEVKELKESNRSLLSKQKKAEKIACQTRRATFCKRKDTFAWLGHCALC